MAEEPRYGAEYLARAWLGQGAFRVLVTDAHGRLASAEHLLFANLRAEKDSNRGRMHAATTRAI
jgi:hypothetical protein